MLLLPQDLLESHFVLGFTQRNQDAEYDQDFFLFLVLIKGMRKHDEF